MGKIVDAGEYLWDHSAGVALDASGKVIKNVTDGLGLTDHEGQERRREEAKSASDRANSAQDKAFALAEQNQEFQKEQYNDWKAIYGDLQENLGEYYKNLGSEKIASMGLQRQQQAHQQSVKQIKQNLARKGRGGSKFEDYVLAGAEVNNASQRANIQSNAELQAQQQKLQFLSLGLGQGSQLQGNVSNAAGLSVNARQNQANTLSGQANMYNQQFVNTQNNNANMMRQLVDTGTEIVGAALGGA